MADSEFLTWPPNRRSRRKQGRDARKHISRPYHDMFATVILCKIARIASFSSGLDQSNLPSCLRIQVSYLAQLFPHAWGIII